MSQNKSPPDENKQEQLATKIFVTGVGLVTIATLAMGGYGIYCVATTGMLPSELDKKPHSSSTCIRSPHRPCTQAPSARHGASTPPK